MRDRPPVDLSRRRMLLTAATAPLASFAACDSVKPKEGFLGRMERWNLGVERALFGPERPQRAPHAVGAAAGQFPVYFISPSVPIAPPGWALRVGGMVARPTAFTLADLQRMPRTDLRLEHHCVEGWSAVMSWHGVQLREVARIVGADPRAGYVEFRSFDNGYHSSWDRESALHPQTLLAYGRDGANLPVPYGAPVRVYSPTKLGYKNVKYLAEVNFLPHETGGYWENLGYEWYGGV